MYLSKVAPERHFVFSAKTFPKIYDGFFSTNCIYIYENIIYENINWGINMSDAELVKLVLDGDINRFSELIQKYQGTVQGLAYHLAGNFEDAEDIAQEAFVSAYIRLRQLQKPERFVSWLRQITINCCKMQIRRRKEIVPLNSVEESFLGISSTPIDEIEQKESYDLVHRALSQLNEDNRLVIILYYLNGESYKDIANFRGPFNSRQSDGNVIEYHLVVYIQMAI